MIREDLKKKLKRLERQAGTDERFIFVHHIPRPPGRPLGVQIGKSTWALVMGGPDLTEEEIADLRKQYGLEDEPQDPPSGNSQ